VYRQRSGEVLGRRPHDRGETEIGGVMSHTPSIPRGRRATSRATNRARRRSGEHDNDVTLGATEGLLIDPSASWW
jgi:hypothetical protein